MKKLLILLLALSMVIIAGCSNEAFYKDGVSGVETATEVESEFYKKMQTDTRPVAVMIDNEKPARPQLGLESADIVYEIIVEGGATRFMALFKEHNLEKIGPVRSARHYFLDYAMEHDAIYCHAGWSPQASRDIKKFGVNNINGILGSDGQIYWRDRTYDNTWHNLYTGLDKLYDMAVDTKKYNGTTEVKSPLYYKNDTDLQSEKALNKITLPYSDMYSVSYEYDAENKVYKRFVDGKEHMSQTGECLSAKNIIVYRVMNYTLNDGENKGRQDLKNIGSGEGYYITNGKVIDIKWHKESRTAKTVYTTADGVELMLNPGNTFIQIMPVNSSITAE